MVDMTKPKPKDQHLPVGRPPMKLSNEQRELALKLAAEGKSLDKIREAISVGLSEPIGAEGFRNYLKRHPEYASDFADARQDGLEELADKLLTITDDEPDVLRARLKSENTRWVLSKRKPHVYGDRLDLNVTKTVDIGAALLEARSRVSIPTLAIEAESTVITDTSTPSATDCESVGDDIFE